MAVADLDNIEAGEGAHGFADRRPGKIESIAQACFRRQGVAGLELVLFDVVGDPIGGQRCGIGALVHCGSFRTVRYVLMWFSGVNRRRGYPRSVSAVKPVTLENVPSTVL